MESVKKYPSPKFEISKAYSIEDVANVLGVSRRSIDRCDPNKIFSMSMLHNNKRYFEKERVIQYQETNILSNIDLLLEEVENEIEYFDYNTEEVIEIEFMNVNIQVGVRITGFTGYDNIKCIELMDVDHNRSYIDAYNKEYDELPKLIEELKNKVSNMVERMNKENGVKYEY